MQVGAEEEVEGAEVVEAVVQELGDGQRVAAAWEEVQPRILQWWLEHRQAQDEVHRSCNTFDRSLDRKNVLRQPLVLPGAYVIHFPKCKTVVLDYEVLGGRNGMERWCLSVLLSSGLCSSDTSCIWTIFYLSKLLLHL